jgi:hypothetical protein
MATTMRAGDVTLHDLGARFGLQFTKDATFFPEWHAELPEISEQEQQQLDRIQTSYLHLVSQTSMVEDVVKMAVLAPLLYLADFFLPPLAIQSEVAVQLSIADEELAIEGKIDILVLHNRLWIHSSNQNGRRPRSRLGSHNCWRICWPAPTPCNQSMV